jgi:hypothetical protein
MVGAAQVSGQIAHVDKGDIDGIVVKHEGRTCDMEGKETRRRPEETCLNGSPRFGGG